MRPVAVGQSIGHFGYTSQMKTINATDAKNRFGAFLDAGMTEGVRLVRNNRVIGYFVPAPQYAALTEAARGKPLAIAGKRLTEDQLEALRLYSERHITSTEAKASLGVDRWGLLELLAEHGLRLPRLSNERAERDAIAAFFPSEIAEAREQQEAPPRG
jgi:predicted DNA-binding protein (UPF0251 family)